MFDALKAKDEGPVTWAEPDDGSSFSSVLQRAVQAPARYGAMAAMAPADIALHPETYGAIFTAAERQQRLVNNMFADERSLEEAYDQRIAAVRTATGQELENPLRGGYAQAARRQIQQEVRAGGMQPIDAKGGIPEYQRRIFDQEYAALREKHPDLPDGDLRREASDIAKQAEEGMGTAAGAPGVNPAGSLVAQFGGSMWASRRDPIFVGSMFLGPTSAMGKTVIARMATSGLIQGAYNAGLAALEQPAVQAWRREAGLRSGTEPAIENVGMAFLSGLIPGAALKGGQEVLAHNFQAARPAIERAMSGNPEPGDAELIAGVMERARAAQHEALSPIETRAIKTGEDMQAADRATEPTIEGQERIVAAAVRVNGEIFTGSNHAMAASEAARLRGVDIGKLDLNDIDGWFTSSGRYVGREEAAQIADRASQVRDEHRGASKLESSTMQYGWFSQAKLEAAKTEPARPAITPEHHDDLTAAALKRADDPEAPSPEATNYIEVYHGSPHDFEQFDVSKIGTGEGAQSYGHGIYLAENPEVAGGYKERLAAKQAPMGGAPKGKTEIRHEDGMWNVYVDGEIQNGFGAKLDAEKYVNKGNLYRARILADKEHFLDWDKPLSEQSPHVQEVLKKLGIEGDRTDGEEFAGQKITFAPRTGAEIYRKLQPTKTREGGSGDKTYPINYKDDAEASKILQESGIPGIKYLDQGSRMYGDQQLIDSIKAQRDELLQLIKTTKDPSIIAGMQGRINSYNESLQKAESKTRNYVVFNDKDIQITHKNDVPMDAEIESRLAKEQPKTADEAKEIIDEAIDDAGRRQGNVVLQQQMADQSASRAEQSAVAQAAEKPARGDVMGKIPHVDDDGSVKMITPSAAAKLGEAEDKVAMLIRSCK